MRGGWDTGTEGGGGGGSSCGCNTEVVEAERGVAARRFRVCLCGRRRAGRGEGALEDKAGRGASWRGGEGRGWWRQRRLQRRPARSRDV